MTKIRWRLTSNQLAILGAPWFPLKSRLRPKRPATKLKRPAAKDKP